MDAEYTKHLLMMQTTPELSALAAILGMGANLYAWLPVNHNDGLRDQHARRDGQLRSVKIREIPTQRQNQELVCLCNSIDF